MIVSQPKPSGLTLPDHGCQKHTLPTFFVTNGVVQIEDVPLLKVISVGPKPAVLLFVVFLAKMENVS